jgi:hypothetical protein
MTAWFRLSPVLCQPRWNDLLVVKINGLCRGRTRVDDKAHYVTGIATSARLLGMDARSRLGRASMPFSLGFLGFNCRYLVLLLACLLPSRGFEVHKTE